MTEVSDVPFPGRRRRGALRSRVAAAAAVSVHLQVDFGAARLTRSGLRGHTCRGWNI